MAQARETIWFIGEARDRELRFCLREIEALAQGRTIKRFATGDEVDPANNPDLVVVWQDWPNQYPEATTNRLMNLTMPAGRLLCVYGSWCESDGRNLPELWPHAVRVAARNAPERFERELKAVSHREPPLPLTASRDERFEHNHSDNPPDSLRRVTAAVVSDDSQLKATLIKRLEHGGVTVADDTRTCDTIVWTQGLPEQDMDSTTEFTREHSGRKVISIRSMPDPASRNQRDFEELPMLVNDRQLLKALYEK
jgi:hypothetical protein